MSSHFLAYTAVLDVAIETVSGLRQAISFENRDGIAHSHSAANRFSKTYVFVLGKRGFAAFVIKFFFHNKKS